MFANINLGEGTISIYRAYKKEQIRYIGTALFLRKNKNVEIR